MSKTGTSNEVSTKKKEKDLLSKYPYEVKTRAVFFEPRDLRVQETIYDMVGLPGTEFVVVKLENGTRAKEDFDKIPVKKSTAKKASKKSSSSNIAEER